MNNTHTHLGKEAVHRRRRIIFQNDGDDALAYSEKATPEALLDVRTSPLVGSQVDMISYCSTQSFGLSLHNSKVTQVQKSTDGIYAKNIVRELIKQGTDPLEIMVDFGHKNSMEVFWSMRMNDVHEGDPKYPELFPQFKRDHPEYLFGAMENKPEAISDARIWCGVDYGFKEVRDLAYRTIEEVCEQYDVDGIELDFFRHPVFFKKHAWGESLGRKELDIMTGLMREVREMTVEVSKKRERPLLISVRVPDSVGYCNAVGLDLVRWLKENLIDILIPGGYFRLSAWEDSVALGHKYDIPVYPSLDESRMQEDVRDVRNSIECYRARAMNVWNSGADGIYLFNLFNPHSPHWRELGDPEELEKLDKLYCVAVRGPRLANAYLPEGDRFLRRPSLCPELPEFLKPGKSVKVPLLVGDNVMWGKTEGIIPLIRLSIYTMNVSDSRELSVTLNDININSGVMSGEWIEYNVSPELVKKGTNSFKITYKGTGQDSAVLKDLQLKIVYNE